MDKLPTEIFERVYLSLDCVSKLQFRLTCWAYFLNLIADKPRNPYINFRDPDRAFTFCHDVLAFWLQFADRGLTPGYAQKQTIQIAFDYMDMAQSEWDILCLAISKAQPTCINISNFQFAVTGSFIRIAQLVSSASRCTVMRLKHGVSARDSDYSFLVTF